MTISISRKHLIIGFVLLLAFVAVQGVSAADNETIYACVNARGIPRIVDAGETCLPNETALEWNVQGTSGADGQDGTDGTDGQDGIDGVSGYEVIQEDGWVEEHDWGGVSLQCPDGKSVLGGGYYLGGGYTAAPAVNQPSYNLQTGLWDSWTVYFFYDPETTNGDYWIVYAICAYVGE